MINGGPQVSAQNSATKKPNNKCKWCGDAHPRGKANCKAVGQKCKKCGKNGHFEKVCRSTKSDESQQLQQLDDQLGENCNIFIDSNKDFWYSASKNYLKEAEKSSIIEKSA